METYTNATGSKTIEEMTVAGELEKRTIRYRWPEHVYKKPPSTKKRSSYNVSDKSPYFFSLLFGLSLSLLLSFSFSS